MDFQINHPSVVLIPQTAGSWNTNSLISLIEQFKNTYRIDESRIYLIGYSMGAYEAYALANGYYDYNSQLFAGIIHLAGVNYAKPREAIVENTAVWFHIGLEETTGRITGIRNAYQYLKDYHTNSYKVGTDEPEPRCPPMSTDHLRSKKLSTKMSATALSPCFFLSQPSSHELICNTPVTKSNFSVYKNIPINFNKKIKDLFLKDFTEINNWHDFGY